MSSLFSASHLDFGHTANFTQLTATLSNSGRPSLLIFLPIPPQPSLCHPMDPSQQDPPPSPPKLTRLLTFLQILFSLLSQPQVLGSSITDSFALLPLSTIGASKVWNVVTAGFFDLNLVLAVFNAALFFTVGRWIEMSWGAPLLIVYLVLVNAIAGIFTYALMLAAYLLTQIDRFLFSPVATSNAMCVALLVAVKQLIPDHEIGLYSLKLPASVLPLCYLTLMFLLTLVRLISLAHFSFTLAAFQSSWVYLRYFQRRNGVRGDLSETFSYASLFPEPLRTIVAIFANFAFMLFKPLLAAGLTANNDAQQNPQQQAPVSKAASIDAERRRQRALRALDERLNATTTDEAKPENAV